MRGPVLATCVGAAFETHAQPPLLRRPTAVPEVMVVSDSNALVSRRQFCSGACQVASCATLATVFSACGQSPTSPSGMVSNLARLAGQFASSSVRVNVSGSPLATAGGAALVESTAGVFLVSRTSETAFIAVDAVCTHQSCTITGVDGATYVCQCHGSRYDRNGRVVGGPAPASLRQYPASFVDGNLVIAI